MRAALLALLLTGCSHYWTHESGEWVKRLAYAGCMFGGATEEADAICAERNFGKEGAAYIVERERLCKTCDPNGENGQYCVLNCRE